MIYKQYEMLSEYLITSDGNVIELDTMCQVDLIPDNVVRNQINYKLLTDETFYSSIKDCDVRLWRRYESNDIIRMYNSPKAIVFNSTQVVTDTTKSAQVIKSAQVATIISAQVEESAQVSAGKSAQVSINGIVYKSISDASAQVNINRRTIKKRLEDPSNKAYYYL